MLKRQHGASGTETSDKQNRATQLVFWLCAYPDLTCVSSAPQGSGSLEWGKDSADPLLLLYLFIQ